MGPIWWGHQMETFSRYWPFVRGIHRSPVNSPHKGQWRGALMLSLICAWINGWVSTRDAGDLRRHRLNYDVIVMTWIGMEFIHCENNIDQKFPWFSHMITDKNNNLWCHHLLLWRERLTVPIISIPCQWHAYRVLGSEADMILNYNSSIFTSFLTVH